MTLDYIYHSGFAIEMEGVTVIIDYYKDSSETEHNRGTVADNQLTLSASDRNHRRGRWKRLWRRRRNVRL